MEQRLDYQRASPEACQALRSLDGYVRQCGLEEPLVELVKVRVSQLNGCAYCLDMHTKVARSRGESEQRLYSLDAWREAPFYSERERAALAWAEALTRMAEGHVPDEIFREARRWFSDKELVDLSLAVTAINGWNRLGIGFRAQAGTFRL
jgi:AhpD family alkylhydroperoxidase